MFAITKAFLYYIFTLPLFLLCGTLPVLSRWCSNKQLKRTMSCYLMNTLHSRFFSHCLCYRLGLTLWKILATVCHYKAFHLFSSSFVSFNSADILIFIINITKRNAKYTQCIKYQLKRRWMNVRTTQVHLIVRVSLVFILPLAILNASKN